MGGLPK